MSNPVKSVTLKVRDKTYTNYRLKTATLSLFNQYHDMFYNWNPEKGKYIKIVPKNISEFMDPIVLAYLIMSDGNFDKNRNRVRIFTNSFTKEEVQILADAINAKLGIYVGVLHDRKDQWILTIGAKQLDFLDFCKAAEIIASKGHLTIEGATKLDILKSGMNDSRKILNPITTVSKQKKEELRIVPYEKKNLAIIKYKPIIKYVIL